MGALCFSYQDCNASAKARSGPNGVGVDILFILKGPFLNKRVNQMAENSSKKSSGYGLLVENGGVKSAKFQKMSVVSLYGPTPFPVLIVVKCWQTYLRGWCLSLLREFVTADVTV
eukprot:12629020-Ditylum_brightwellii.AAC.1